MSDDEIKALGEIIVTYGVHSSIEEIYAEFDGGSLKYEADCAIDFISEMLHRLGKYGMLSQSGCSFKRYWDLKKD